MNFSPKANPFASFSVWTFVPLIVGCAVRTPFEALRQNTLGRGQAALGEAGLGFLRFLRERRLKGTPTADPRAAMLVPHCYREPIEGAGGAIGRAPWRQCLPAPRISVVSPDPLGPDPTPLGPADAPAALQAPP